MGSSSSKNGIFFIGIVLVLALAAAWYFFFSTPEIPEEGLITSTGPGAISGSPSSAEVRSGILGNIEAIKSIRLDTTILDDPAFLRLEKVERPPVADPGLGRENPFLPYEFAPTLQPSASSRR